MTASSPERRLDRFIARYTPEIAARGRAALVELRTILPGAVEMVYDNYNALVVGFGPTERASEAVVSVALYPRWVNLFFLKGAKLPDPKKRLQGKGSIVRHITLTDAETLHDPAVQALFGHALAAADWTPDPATPGRIVVKSVATNQRPRRPK